MAVSSHALGARVQTVERAALHLTPQLIERPEDELVLSCREHGVDRAGRSRVGWKRLAECMKQSAATVGTRHPVTEPGSDPAVARTVVV